MLGPFLKNTDRYMVLYFNPHVVNNSGPQGKWMFKNYYVTRSRAEQEAHDLARRGEKAVVLECLTAFVPPSIPKVTRLSQENK